VSLGLHLPSPLMAFQHSTVFRREPSLFDPNSPRSMAVQYVFFFPLLSLFLTPFVFVAIKDRVRLFYLSAGEPPLPPSVPHALRKILYSCVSPSLPAVPRSPLQPPFCPLDHTRSPPAASEATYSTSPTLLLSDVVVLLCPFFLIFWMIPAVHFAAPRAMLLRLASLVELCSHSFFHDGSW